MKLTAAVVLACAASAVSARASEQRLDVYVRLLSPVASFSPNGTPVQVKVLGPVRAGAAPDLPPGAVISGYVHRAVSVGLGVRRERASLDLRFDRCQLPGQEEAPCDVVLAGVDNARESVTKDGRIQGILAASHMHSWLGGLWIRPGHAVSRRSASGLTGAGGKIQNSLAPTPAGAAVMVASRLLLFRLPDPEIHLPAGADLILSAAGSHGDDAYAPSWPLIDQDLGKLLGPLPYRVMAPDGKPAADIVNFAFFGSAGDVAAAFAAAGWSTADPLTAKTFARTYSAYAGMKPYPTAPVSPLYYQGRLPDLVFQRSFNSVAKRHHIRLWRTETPMGEIWLGAATHDTGIVFDWSRKAFLHRIDHRIDIERQKVIHDLVDGGCVAEPARVERPGIVQIAKAAGAITDGALAVLEVRDCDGEAGESGSPEWAGRRYPALIARRVILETRHYVTRGNPYYWAYRGTRWTVGQLAAPRPRSERPGGPEPAMIASR